MKTIRKYPLARTDIQFIKIPTGPDYRVLTAQIQGERICVWCVVDDADPEVEHRFRIAGTGNLLECFHSETYVGTVQDDRFVWHVFENKRLTG